MRGRFRHRGEIEYVHSPAGIWSIAQIIDVGAISCPAAKKVII